MRVLLLAIFSCFPLAAQSLDFIKGVWFSAAGEPRQTIEFHLDTQQGVPVLIGREWASHTAPACPWCITNTAMTFSVAADSKQLVLHFRNRGGEQADFRLVEAHKWYLHFQRSEAARQDYGLTIQIRRLPELEISGSDGSRALFHRY
jgi:hypothetical protein